ncbi:TRAP transporter small permease [Aquibacillus kalidii]|uniref:TRAP transporter small permease n=1 Tax=Aquibacillus kalidii TaxID=2762597 RepID=UPI00164870F3|nr:TRAP transporter small permease [Aquibacillus kalidii]
MNFFRAIDKFIMKLEEFILSFSVIVISVMVVGNVIAREIFNSSAFFFYLEVSKFAIVIATFMGIAYAARKGRHISMSAFYDFAPKKGRKVMMIIINGVTAIVMFVLAYYSYNYVMSEFKTGSVTPALQIPQYLMVVFIPIGFLMGGIQFVRNTWINIRSKDKVYIGIDAIDYNDKEKRDVEDQIQV